MKILLVDDSNSAALVMTARLSSYGHTLIRAVDGQDAVEAFKAHAPDLVLMDLEMPRLNGIEATNRIRAEEAKRQWAWTPIIFLTASSDSTCLVTAINAGADDFISKSSPEPVLRAKMMAMARISALRESVYRANLKLQELASLDGLTGLANRRRLDERSDVLWRKSQITKRPFAVLMVDIDRFKQYNDFYSHQAGDECLRKVAQTVDAVVRGCGRGDMLAARYGGEEFAAIVCGLGKADASALGQRVVRAVSELELVHEHNPPWGVVTISAGLAWGDRFEGSVGQAFRWADEALYLAKHGGRNCLATRAWGSS